MTPADCGRKEHMTTLDITNLRIQPGDTILVKYTKKPTDIEVDEIATYFEEYFPDNRVLLLDNTIKVSVQPLKIILELNGGRVRETV